MITAPVTSAADTGLPSIEDLRDLSYIVEGLIIAADEMSDRLGPRANPVFACIVSAKPIAERLARGLDEITTRMPA
jgi:hypothetical protein